MTSALVIAALKTEKQLRREFADYRHMAYQRAADACHGRLLNPRGIKAGIDSRDLFERNRQFLDAYASEELQEHLRCFGRMSFDQWLHQHQESAA